MKQIILYSYPDWKGPSENIDPTLGRGSKKYLNTDMQSGNIRSGLLTSNIPFTEIRLDGDTVIPTRNIQHSGSAFACIDIDGFGYKFFPSTPNGQYVNQALLDSWKSAPDTLEQKPKPLAQIVTKHQNGNIDIIFDVGEPVTIEVDIRTPDDSALYTAFAGSFVVPVSGPGKFIPIKFTFTGGIASKVIVFNEPGIYSVGQDSSDLVKISPFSIQVTL